MARKTRVHDRCQPTVVRDRHSCSIAMPVIRPDGRADALVSPLTPEQAAHIAGELLAFVSQHLADERGRKAREWREDVASDRA